MGYPVFGYLSMTRLSTTTVTDPGTETGFAIANLSDLKPYTYWKSDDTTAPIHIDIDAGASGANANYLALVNHNLNTLGATVRVLGDGSSPPTTELLAATAVGEDTVTYFSWTAPGAVRYWRVTINHASPPFSAAPFAACLFLGMKTTSTEYLAPDFSPFMRQDEVSGQRSEGGHYLAGVIRGQRHRGTIRLGGAAGVARAFHDSDLTDFYNNHLALRRPFVFVLDPDDTDFDTAYYLKMTDGGQIGREAVGGAWSARLTFELPYEEAYSEPSS